MKTIRRSLFAKIFSAIAATAVLVVMVMAVIVAFWMRDGFAQYLLRGELARFDDLTSSLADVHPGGWTQFADNPQQWSDFVRTHARRPGIDSGRPPRPPPGGPPPTAGKPPPLGAGGEGLRLDERLVLLDREGYQLAGNPERTKVFERRPICAQGDCADGELLGYLGMNAPVAAESASDAFFLRGQYLSLLLAALIAIAVSAIAAYIIARQLLGPIRRLEAGAKTMASGNYTARIRQNRKDELGQLIGHYNTLAATLEQTERAEREWISNTSHELQTPLAVLRAQIEALQDGIRQPDEKTLTEMHAALMRLSRLVQDLKTLSYAREAELAANFAREDLSGLARVSADAARLKLVAQGIDLDLDLAAPMLIECDGVQIGQVIDNLLENARRYTDGPGKVRMNLEEIDGFAVLSVDDTPPAPPDADVGRLFDRFFRAEGSRSRASGGSGLGLSVCKAIVEAHGGTISAGHSVLGGLQIIIRLPKDTA
ncbi:ATPase, histidine kinase-, DNA gyrase B-, and HSP90-like domain protein [Sulfitobacter noctilucae]|uniref:ATP-binding protein n=1 Tax=Sulfitobacter noctilucae TaxID=1342302 RepID=UPI0004687A35|nr:ATP-binding protein [Sulfitobacter noctilucae]KIN70990.1 ATPase, histidine kinase-, DNA gyrase B-, and HSP90-like domain protein [Sulfitobacter noctilucae]